ncbi:hypothetical protein V9T40_003641 [Parthenolecanium corni]|uniref:Rap-GAP domain-containing protein n=1 Tax=Parthenolecanium corni TaxID=536013 RepID=A0AAN9TTU5_9HEMI
MFSKKTHGDIKKSAQKINDLKKDTVTRYKHLKHVLEHITGTEAKSFFETNYSNIYHIFYDNFIIAEANLKQKELPFHLVHKAHKEELENVLYVLEKILLLCPELIANRWQCHSLTRVLTKLLHPGNSWKLRREAIKYFVIWYQILGDNVPENAHAIFATIVPGFSSPIEGHEGLEFLLKSPAVGTFYSDSPVTPADIQPTYPPPSGEKAPEDLMKFFLDSLLEFMVTQVARIKWNDKWSDKRHKCFTFLFEKFKKYYLPIIFSDYSEKTNIYYPVLDLPESRYAVKTDRYLNCRVSVIKWVANFAHDVKHKSHSSSSTVMLASKPSVQLPQNQESSDQSVPLPIKNPPIGEEIVASQNPDDVFCASFQTVRDVLFCCKENINFVHEIFRQAFLLPFNCSPAIRRTIAVHKDWIQMNVAEIPPFMLEPIERMDGNHSEITGSEDTQNSKPLRIRNDSYIGAITRENFIIRAGLQNTLQLFITHAANVFLLETSGDSVMLEEQVDICKRVLNMYRYMVMHTHMEVRTWEQLLLILLRITSLTLGTGPAKKKEHLKLGGRLAQAVFQTLIVTWIKANLNVAISSELWDQFCDILSSLTMWEELITEWAKTMDTLTRVLARHVYNLDLSDLPLDRLSEQKRKKGFLGANRKNTASKENVVKREETNIVTKNVEAEISDSNEKIVEIKRATSYSLRRSKSDTNVSCSKKIIRKELLINPPDSSDTSFETISLTSETKPESKTKTYRKWRSLDSLKGNAHDSMSEPHSRSASPAPSSGLENNSIKDAPIQIEVASNESSIQEENQRSVIAGGTIRGWLPDVAIVLWKRMLGSLGNVNKISDPNLHAQVFYRLIELMNTLIKMRMNQGVPEDNQKTPQIPEYIPPLTIFAPWCFEALKLPSEFHKGKLSAYKLLCQMTLSAPNSCLPRSHISKFYNVLHAGLISSDKSIVYTIMKHTGSKFFSRQLPGYTLLIPYFIQACETILLNEDLGLTPRPDAVSVLTTLLSFSGIVENFPSFKKTPNIGDDLKLRIVRILLHTAKREQSGLAKCVALSGLGIYLIQEFEKGSKHASVNEAFNVILLALRFNHETVAQVACDIVFLICDYVNVLSERYPELLPRTIEVLADTINSMMPIEDGRKRLLTSLLICLAEWTMCVPTQVLLETKSDDNSSECLLHCVFKVLEELSNGGRQKCAKLGDHFTPEFVKEFSFNVALDNLKPDEYEQRSFNGIAPTHLNSTRHSLQLAAKMVSAHLLSILGQFPIIPGAARLSSLVTEQDDNSSLTNDQLSSEIFSLPNLLMFVSTNNLILSMLDLPALVVPGGGVTAGLITAASQVRILLRSLNGRFCWDASILFCTPEQLSAMEREDERLLLINSKKEQVEDVPFISYVTSSPLQNTIRHRPPHILPTVENSAPDLDNLDDLLQYIGYTSPECLEDPESPLNMASTNAPFGSQLEQDTISAILSQKCLENEYLSQALTLSPPFENRPKYKDAPSSFQYSRLLLSQLGFMGWDMRSRLYLLQKTEKVLREIRNLDSQFCRETHKIAVIYVAKGQEDKVSILSNIGGSQKYEDFIAALAWEIELESHTGFMGGLQRNKTTGVTAPYFATSFSELILHVSTRMSSSTPEALINKTRHLGNDEVHIVWSEHTRDYRRGILPTEFCDILIVIYPLPHNLYRVQISKKPEVPFFGPCFTETIVEFNLLPSLVRAVAINSSRAKRSMLPFHQQHYEERFRSLETIVRDYKTRSTFEDFAGQVFSPGSASVVAHSNSRSGNEEPAVGNSWSVAENVDLETSAGISPRLTKKPSGKGGARRSMIVSPSLTPPDSPTLRKSK